MKKVNLTKNLKKHFKVEAKVKSGTGLPNYLAKYDPSLPQTWNTENGSLFVNTPPKYV